MPPPPPPVLASGSLADAPLSPAPEDDCGLDVSQRHEAACDETSSFIRSSRPPLPPSTSVSTFADSASATTVTSAASHTAAPLGLPPVSPLQSSLSPASMLVYPSPSMPLDGSSSVSAGAVGEEGLGPDTLSLWMDTSMMADSATASGLHHPLYFGVAPHVSSLLFPDLAGFAAASSSQGLPQSDLAVAASAVTPSEPDPLYWSLLSLEDPSTSTVATGDENGAGSTLVSMTDIFPDATDAGVVDAATSVARATPDAELELPPETSSLFEPITSQLKVEPLSGDWPLASFGAFSSTRHSEEPDEPPASPV
ncbi:hypothetical protein HK405_002677, partial [Cladochytrium tenue]